MWLLALFGAGLISLWTGERIVESSEFRWALSGLGLALVVASTLGRLLWRKNLSPARATVQQWLFAFQLLALAALGAYAFQGDVYSKLSSTTLESTAPKLAASLAALWPALLTLAFLPVLFVEIALYSSSKAPNIEEGRVKEALFGGVALAAALIFAFSMQYVFSERDSKVDLSYFRVARPSDATKRLVASLDEPVEVYLFYPPASDTAVLVQDYFDEVAKSSPQLTVTRLDHALEPTKAKELGVSGNGTILFSKGKKHESSFVAIEVEKARTQLRGLDSEIQKKLSQIAKSKRTVYFTAGHAERTQDALGGAEQRATVEILYKTLEDQNFEVRQLSSAEGLGQEIPKDAAAVFVMGPTREFTSPEALALENYFKRGGRLFVALDPENALPFDNFLRSFAVSMKPVFIAQERGTANLRPPPSLADRINIGTRTFSSHPIVSFLSRTNNAVLLVGAGPLDELPQHPADVSVDMAVKTLAEAWLDVKHNFEFDAADQETKNAFGVVAAVTRRAASNKPEEEGRALIISDSDGIADAVLPLLPGNQALVVDGFKWLLGDEALAGPTNTEIDVPLARSRQQDTFWFYGATLFAPLSVLALGALMSRKKKGATS
jgi:hypothetical protein